MRRGMILAAAFACLASLASAQPRSNKWELGGVYRSMDGHGAVVTGAMSDINGTKTILIVTIIETPPIVRWRHSSTFFVRLGERLNHWLPANLCTTQPRQYVNADGTWTNWEVDRYTSFDACPLVPIE